MDQIRKSKGLNRVIYVKWWAFCFGGFFFILSICYCFNGVLCRFEWCEDPLARNIDKIGKIDISPAIMLPTAKHLRESVPIYILVHFFFFTHWMMLMISQSVPYVISVLFVPQKNISFIAKNKVTCNMLCLAYCQIQI